MNFLLFEIDHLQFYQLFKLSIICLKILLNILSIFEWNRINLIWNYYCILLLYSSIIFHILRQIFLKAIFLGWFYIKLNLKYFYSLIFLYKFLKNLFLLIIIIFKLLFLFIFQGIYLQVFLLNLHEQIYP